MSTHKGQVSAEQAGIFIEPPDMPANGQGERRIRYTPAKYGTPASHAAQAPELTSAPEVQAAAEKEDTPNLADMKSNFNGAVNLILANSEVIGQNIEQKDSDIGTRLHQALTDPSLTPEARMILAVTLAGGAHDIELGRHSLDIAEQTGKIKSEDLFALREFYETATELRTSGSTPDEVAGYTYANALSLASSAQSQALIAACASGMAAAGIAAQSEAYNLQNSTQSYLEHAYSQGPKTTTS